MQRWKKRFCILEGAMPFEIARVPVSMVFAAILLTAAGASASTLGLSSSEAISDECLCSPETGAAMDVGLDNRFMVVNDYDAKASAAIDGSTTLPGSIFMRSVDDRSSMAEQQSSDRQWSAHGAIETEILTNAQSSRSDYFRDLVSRTSDEDFPDLINELIFSVDFNMENLNPDPSADSSRVASPPGYTNIVFISVSIFDRIIFENIRVPE
jgi:hypothetical protein